MEYKLKIGDWITRVNWDKNYYKVIAINGVGFTIEWTDNDNEKQTSDYTWEECNWIIKKQELEYSLF